MTRWLLALVVVAVAAGAAWETRRLVTGARDQTAAAAAADTRLEAAASTMGLLPALDRPSPEAPLAPPLSGVAQDGRGYSLASLRGAPALVIFLDPDGYEEKFGYAINRTAIGKRDHRDRLNEEWRTLHVGLGPRGLGVLGASGAEASVVERFARTYHLRFPIVHAVSTRAWIGWRLAESSTPRAFLVDKRGRVIAGHRARPGPPPALVDDPLGQLGYEFHFFAGLTRKVVRRLAERYLEFRHLGADRRAAVGLGGLAGAGHGRDPFLDRIRTILPAAARVRVVRVAGRARGLFEALDAAGGRVGWVRPIEVDGPGEESVQVLLAFDAAGTLRAAEELRGAEGHLGAYVGGLGGLAASAPVPAPGAGLDAPWVGPATAVAALVDETRALIATAR